MLYLWDQTVPHFHLIIHGHHSLFFFPPFSLFFSRLSPSITFWLFLLSSFLSLLFFYCLLLTPLFISALASSTASSSSSSPPVHVVCLWFQGQSIGHCLYCDKAKFMCVCVLTQQGVGCHRDRATDKLAHDTLIPYCDLPSKLSVCIMETQSWHYLYLYLLRKLLVLGGCKISVFASFPPPASSHCAKLSEPSPGSTVASY